MWAGSWVTSPYASMSWARSRWNAKQLSRKLRVSSSGGAGERQANKPEVQRMQQLVREGMEAGAFGFSTNRNERHMREDGKPVPSRMADIEELLSLCDPLGDLNAGVIQSTLGQYK